MMLDRPLPSCLSALLLALVLALVAEDRVALADEPTADPPSTDSEQSDSEQTQSEQTEPTEIEGTNPPASTTDDSTAEESTDNAEPATAEARTIEGAASAPGSIKPTPPAAAPQDPLPPGQADLDKAIELRLLSGNSRNANTVLRDLNKIIELIDSSVEKGVEPENEEFANSILSSTLMQRATLMSAAVLNRRRQANPQGDPRWIQVRQLALSDLQRAVELDPKMAKAHLLIGRLQSTQWGDPNAARRAFTKAIDSDPEAIEPAERAQAYVLRGATQRDADKRLADFTQALEIEPSKTEYLILRAREYQRRQDNDAAMTDIDAALASDPDNAGGHELRGVILLGQEKTAEAIESLDKSIKLNPDAPNPRLLRSQLYLLDNQNEEALADVEAVLAREPGSLRAHLLRVQVLNKLGRQADAMEALGRIGRAAQNRPDVLLELARIYQTIDELDESIDTLTRIIDQAPGNTRALRLRGDTYLTTGDHPNALADFARAYEIEPDDSGLLNNYAWTLATSPRDDLRDGPRALELAERAAELTEFQKPHILSTLAAAHAEMGDFDRAIEFAEKAVTLEKKQGAGPEVGEEIDEQLAAELASYRAGKPWRELQEAGVAVPVEPTPDPVEAQPSEDPLDRAFDF